MGRFAQSNTLRAFSCFTTDERYSVPSLQFVFAFDAAGARVQAIHLLMEDIRHAAVEVREEDEVLFCERRGQRTDPP